MNASGWSLKALEQLTGLTVRLPFEEASMVAHSFALKAGAPELERLSQPYDDSCRGAVIATLRPSKERSNHVIIL